MSISRIICSVFAIGLFGVVSAEEDVHMKVEFLSDDGVNEPVLIEIDGDDMDGNLHDMQEGENRSIIEKEGRAILVTRTADGFVFDVDGKTIEVPLLHAQHGMIAMTHGEHDADVDVQVWHDSTVATDISDGTFIMTDKPVDEATRQAIRSLLESAGHGSEVHFVDHEQSRNVARKVEVVRKVEIAQ